VIADDELPPLAQDDLGIRALERYIATWMVVSGSGPAIVALWWLAGMIVFDLLWLVTRSRSRQGGGLRRLFARPGHGQRRIPSLDESFSDTKPGRDAS
jgi:hypothetical protein